MPATLLGVELSVSSILSFALLAAALWIWLKSATSTSSPRSSTTAGSGTMSRNQKKGEAAMISEFRDVTGASTSDATRYIKKWKNLEQAVDAYFNAGGGSSAPTQDKGREKKLGDVWERFKDPSDPKLIKIDGTMQLCEELGIDPEADAVLFCLAADLGSKATGEWAKDPWVAGWSAMPGNIDSIEGMKSRLPALRKALVSDPAYFKKVYLHTFELIKPAGSRVLPLETAVDMWNLFIPPALSSTPSALANVTSGTAAFSQADFEQWIAFQQKKGKAVSKDTWTLFIDFTRSIDADFKEYDESGAWPSTIDDFVEHMRTLRKC